MADKSGSAGGDGGASHALVDVSQLAARQITKLKGDGSVDVIEWLDSVERLCMLEGVKPEIIIGFLLEGEPLQLYRRLSVGDADKWDVVRKALIDSFALPLPAIFRRFSELKLQECELVDEYMDRL